MSFDSLYNPPQVSMSCTTPVNYLDYVDEDVKKIFTGHNFMSFEPLMYQLHKDILKLCETIESKW
jgi:hypothetical protein